MGEKRVRVIKAAKVWSINDLVEVFRFRELLGALVERNLKVRYRQTVVGAVWAVAQPLAAMVVFSFFFGNLARVASDGVPYPIFSYSGLILWLYFASAITSASNSLVAEANMISKVYFPRIIVPIAAATTSLVDYVISLGVLVVLMVVFGVEFSAKLLLLPAIVGLCYLLVVGIGLWLSSVNVKFRDVRFVVPFLIQMGLFVTPVIYPVSMAGRFRAWLLVNPMTGIIEAHRAVVLNHQAVDGWGLLASGIGTAIILMTGLVYFRKVERYFADVI